MGVGFLPLLSVNTLLGAGWLGVKRRAIRQASPSTGLESSTVLGNLEPCSCPKGKKKRYPQAQGNALSMDTSRVITLGSSREISVLTGKGERERRREGEEERGRMERGREGKGGGERPSLNK